MHKKSICLFTIIGLLLGSLSGTSAVAAQPDITTTVPSRVQLKKGESTYTLDTTYQYELAFNVQLDPGASPNYRATVDGKVVKWASLKPGKHTVVQDFVYERYTYTTASCYVDSWYDGYDASNGSWYTIECNSAWGSVTADEYYSWYEYPSTMRYDDNLPVELDEWDEEYHDWFLVRPTSLKEGKTFAAKLVSRDDPTFKTAQLTTVLEVKAAPKDLSVTTPRISDTTPKVGQRLTAKPGTWRAGAAKLGSSSLTYTWMSGSKVVGRNSTYKVRTSDIGRQITVKVTGRASGYSTASKRSGKTAKVIGTLKATTPKVSDTTPKVGQKLTAKKGSWTSGTKVTYQWYRVSSSGQASKIKGATKSTYTVKPTDRASKLKVKTIGKKANYATATKTSKTTSKVK